MAQPPRPQDQQKSLERQVRQNHLRGPSKNWKQMDINSIATQRKNRQLHQKSLLLHSQKELQKNQQDARLQKQHHQNEIDQTCRALRNPEVR